MAPPIATSTAINFKWPLKREEEGEEEEEEGVEEGENVSFSYLTAAATRTHSQNMWNQYIRVLFLESRRFDLLPAMALGWLCGRDRQVNFDPDNQVIWMVNAAQIQLNAPTWVSTF